MVLFTGSNDKKADGYLLGMLVVIVLFIFTLLWQFAYVSLTQLHMTRLYMRSSHVEYLMVK